MKSLKCSLGSGFVLALVLPVGGAVKVRLTGWRNTDVEMKGYPACRCAVKEKRPGIP